MPLAMSLHVKKVRPPYSPWTKTRRSWLSALLFSSSLKHFGLVSVLMGYAMVCCSLLLPPGPRALPMVTALVGSSLCLAIVCDVRFGREMGDGQNTPKLHMVPAFTWS